MSVAAEWRLAELLGESHDPFDQIVLSTGLCVDLTGSAEEVYAGLKRTLAIESRLFNRGVTCELKDNGQDCLTCPEYVADRAEEPRAPLCRLGRDQRIIVKRYEELREHLFVELAESIEEFEELGQLPGEYEELLTAVGL